jgi:hypothetical protein
MKLKLFADYFQFYLQDDDVTVGNLADAWNPDASERLRVAVAPRVVGVGTARNSTVTVEITVMKKPPRFAARSCEHAVEADLLCETGRIVVAGCTDSFPDARRVRVNKGRWRVRVVYGGRSTSRDALGDRLTYKISLWRSENCAPVAVLKQGPIPWAG